MLVSPLVPAWRCRGMYSVFAGTPGVAAAAPAASAAELQAGDGDRDPESHCREPRAPGFALHRQRTPPLSALLTGQSQENGFY